MPDVYEVLKEFVDLYRSSVNDFGISLNIC